jgi:hypothetical protein
VYVANSLYSADRVPTPPSHNPSSSPFTRQGRGENIGDRHGRGRRDKWAAIMPNAIELWILGSGTGDCRVWGSGEEQKPNKNGWSNAVFTTNGRWGSSG